jgi:BirA family biotin operon repressor/biotin-[acetyl-CoA-carboxylase] ligase
VPPDARDLAARLGLPRVLAFDEVGSTMDVAHAEAALGAPPGTLVVARAQTAGRGRMGRTWRSEPDAGLWLTMIERPRDATALDVLSLRTGLALASALDAYAAEPVRLKWPNDLFVGARKLGGILIETRWRERQLEWVAVGVGINLRPPTGESRAVGLAPGTDRDELLVRAVPAIRAAAAESGPLRAYELAEFAERDLAAGRRCIEPADGIVRGIDASGALLVDVGSPDAPRLAVVRAGSLVLMEDA